MKRYEIRWKDSAGVLHRQRCSTLPDVFDRYGELDLTGSEELELRKVTYRLDKALAYCLILLALVTVIAVVGKQMHPVNSMDVAVLLAITVGSVYTTIQVVKYI